MSQQLASICRNIAILEKNGSVKAPAFKAQLERIHAEITDLNIAVNDEKNRLLRKQEVAKIRTRDNQN